jgi:hypothetical protein
VPGYSATRKGGVQVKTGAVAIKPHKVDRACFLVWDVSRSESSMVFGCLRGLCRLHMLFKENEMMSTKNLYNELWAERLFIILFEVPDA